MADTERRDSDQWDARLGGRPRLSGAERLQLRRSAGGAQGGHAIPGAEGAERGDPIAAIANPLAMDYIPPEEGTHEYSMDPDHVRHMELKTKQRIDIPAEVHVHRIFRPPETEVTSKLTATVP